MEEVKIYTEYIKLDDFLKFAGILGTGGMAKAVIQDGLVTVDGEVCTMRGKKLRGGEVVSFNGETVKVTK
jgi:ribosome-associated protein